MDVSAITSLITTLGFPIVCCVALGWFVYKFYTDSTKQNAENMAQVQARCKEREEKLYEEIKECREVNAAAIATIGKYADNLIEIKADIQEIKEDVNYLTAAHQQAD